VALAGLEVRSEGLIQANPGGQIQTGKRRNVSDPAKFETRDEPQTGANSSNGDNHLDD
jgi:hypothetical protein